MTLPGNPFGGPFGGAPGIGGNPVDNEDNAVVRCPKCKSTNFNAFTNEYGIQRKCLEPGCRQIWSGGSVSSNQHTFIDRGEVLPDGTIAPDIDIPTVQFTGSNFRRPGNNYDGDE